MKIETKKNPASGKLLKKTFSLAKIIYFFAHPIVITPVS
jgi:hypothetical protein